MGIIGRIRERMSRGRPARPAQDRSWETRAVQRHEAAQRRHAHIARLKSGAAHAVGRVARGGRALGGAVGHEVKTAARMRLRKSVRRGFGVGGTSKRRGRYVVPRRPQVIVVGAFGQPQQAAGAPRRRRKQQERSGFQGFGAGFKGYGQ